MIMFSCLRLIFQNGVAEMKNNNEILQLQCAAALVLQQTCAAIHISRVDFSSKLSSFLNAGKEPKGKEEAEAKTRTGKESKDKKGASDLTVLSYFQKLPKKYPVPEEGFELFRMVLENALEDFCADDESIRDRWRKHEKEIMRQLDEIHKRAVEIHSQAVSYEIQEKIKELLSK